MTALRSRRLEALFGVPLGDLKVEHIRGLVDGAVTEQFDLDYKQTTYGSSDADKRALRIDVAALANTAGGVIIIGVAEDDQARAAAALGVPLSDTEVGRMNQIIAGGVSPMPVFDILSIPDPKDPTTGFYVIAVPRSPNAPHAVLVDTSMRFPKRNGATTRYLSEPELAAAYRDRSAGSARQQSRLDEVELDAIERLSLTEDPWLVVTLVPDLPGDMLITAASYSEFETAMRGRSVSQFSSGVYFMRTSVGRRRLLADGGGRILQAEYCSLELHTDGAGAFGMRLWDMNAQHRQEGQPLTNMVSDETVALNLVNGLTWLGKHAVERTAAGGNALVRARLVLQGGAVSIEIGHSRYMGRETRSAVGQNGLPEPAETVAALDDLSGPSTGMGAAVAKLGNELGQLFGIPEMGQFTRTGELNLARWSQDMHQPMRGWAAVHGIPIAGEAG